MMIEMEPPTPEQLKEWRKAAIETQKDLLAGKFDYPNPMKDKIDELERRVAAIEAFLVI